MPARRSYLIDVPEGEEEIERYFLLGNEYESTDAPAMFEKLYGIATTGFHPWVVRYMRDGEIWYDVAVKETDVTYANRIHKDVHDIILEGPQYAFKSRAVLYTGSPISKRIILDIEEVKDINAIITEAARREESWEEIARINFIEHQKGEYNDEDYTASVTTDDFFSGFDALVLKGTDGKWVFFRNYDKAREAAEAFVYHKLETDPKEFDDDLIMRYLSDSGWDNYVTESASSYCNEMSIGDLIDMGQIEQETWDAADERQKSRLEERARERCFEGEVESINEQGLIDTFGGAFDPGGWKKYAMDRLGFDYDRAVDSYMRGRGVAETIATYADEEVELEYPSGVVGYKIEEWDYGTR